MLFRFECSLIISDIINRYRRRVIRLTNKHELFGIVQPKKKEKGNDVDMGDCK